MVGESYDPSCGYGNMEYGILEEAIDLETCPENEEAGSSQLLSRNEEYRPEELGAEESGFGYADGWKKQVGTADEEAKTRLGIRRQYTAHIDEQDPPAALLCGELCVIHTRGEVSQLRVGCAQQSSLPSFLFRREWRHCLLESRLAGIDGLPTLQPTADKRAPLLPSTPLLTRAWSTVVAGPRLPAKWYVAIN